MIIRKIKNQNYKWWNPFTWGEKTELYFEKDLLICTKRFQTSDTLTFNEGSVLCIGESYYRRKQFLKIVEGFLFPKGRRNK